MTDGWIRERRWDYSSGKFPIVHNNNNNNDNYGMVKSGNYMSSISKMYRPKCVLPSQPPR